MLAGVPAHWLLVLLCLGCIAGFGGTMISNLVGAAAAALVATSWGLMALCYRQDKVAVVSFCLRRWTTFNPQVSSYARSRRRVRFD